MEIAIQKIVLVGLAILLPAFAIVAQKLEYPGYYKTPLMKAAVNANIEQIKKLISAGADVNATVGCDWPRAGQCVLSYAINSHSLEVVQILLGAGANVHAFVTSPLILDEGLGKDANPANVRNLSILSHAIRTKAPLSIIKVLITYGAAIDGTPKVMGDWTALMVAAYVNYPEAAEVLLAAGADQHAVNSSDKKTAWDYASVHPDQSVCKLLKKWIDMGL